jgi:peptidoglycan hydrolase-like protein with peptidoglycan-binding domain
MNTTLLQNLYDKYITKKEKLSFPTFMQAMSYEEKLNQFWNKFDDGDKLIYPTFESFKKTIYLGPKKLKNKTGNLFIDYPSTSQPSTGETTTATTATTTTKPTFEWKTTLATPENVENGELIKYGMFGSIVKQIQQLLINNGYKDISKTGQVDGKFGNRTKNAVLSFQKDNGLTQDGVVGPKTWNTLQVPKSTKSIEISTPKELPVNKPEQQPMTTREVPSIQPENYMKKLNNIIKESLIVTKEKKKKTIQESKITNLRFKMIVESETKQDLNTILEEVLMEMIYLHNQGFNSQIISENVDDVFNVLSKVFKKSQGAIVGTFKEKGVNYIITNLGMEKNTYLKNFLTTVLGNTNVVDIPKLFTDCDYLTKKIAEAIPEAYLRQLEYDKGMGNVFMDGIRNALHDVINQSDFAQRIEQNIAGVVCPIVDKLGGKFEDSMGSMKSKLIGNMQA